TDTHHARQPARARARDAPVGRGDPQALRVVSSGIHSSGDERLGLRYRDIGVEGPVTNNAPQDTSHEPTGNLPNAQYRRFEGMREYEALIDALIPQTQRMIRIFDRSLSRA